MAKPFTKPSITGWGTILMNLPSLNTPAKIWIIPINTTVANRYCTATSGPKSALALAIKPTITTAKAPVAPEIIPGLPPIAAVTRPTMNAAHNPTWGDTPAIKAKATASGTNANATVKPDKTSFFKFRGLLNNWFSMLDSMVATVVLKSNWGGVNGSS